MITVFMMLVQLYAKITAVDPRFFYSADFRRKSFRWQTVQRFHQDTRIGAQIEQRRHDHVAADSGAAFQI